jgi:hypothetical protein
VTTGVSGECDPRLGGVQDAFVRNFDERGELGAAVAVWLNGRLVVDLWGGFAGFGIRRPGLTLGYGYVTCLLAGHERTAACEDALDAALGHLG